MPNYLTSSRLEAAPKILEKKTVKLANGVPCENRGASWDPIQIGSSTIRTKVYLLQGLTVPLIIGLDTIQKFKMEYIPQEHAVYLNHGNSSIKEKVHLFTNLADNTTTLNQITIGNHPQLTVVLVYWQPYTPSTY